MLGEYADCNKHFEKQKKMLIITVLGTSINTSRETGLDFTDVDPIWNVE